MNFKSTQRGQKPQASRSMKEGRTLEVLSKAESIEVAKSISVEEISEAAKGWFYSKGEENDEHGEG